MTPRESAIEFLSKGTHNVKSEQEMEMKINAIIVYDFKIALSKSVEEIESYEEMKNKINS